MKMGVNGKPVQHHFWICTAVYLRFLKLKTIGQILQLMRNFMRHQGKRKLSEKFSEKAHYHEQYNKNPKYEEKEYSMHSMRENILLSLYVPFGSEGQCAGWACQLLAAARCP